MAADRFWASAISCKSTFAQETEFRDEADEEVKLSARLDRQVTIPPKWSSGTKRTIVLHLPHVALCGHVDVTTLGHDR